MEVKFLKAGHGDSIHLKIELEEGTKNILIDGGPSKTFMNGSKPGPLKKLISELKYKAQHIDLLILSHVDDDHIAGLLKAFAKKGYLDEITKEVWFNSGRTIKNDFGSTNPECRDIFLSSRGALTSIKQGVSFESKLKELNIWDEKLVRARDQYKKWGVTFDILSPDNESLRQLFLKWSREKPLSVYTSGSKNDYDYSFANLLEEDNFKEDRSVHNGSSIALLITANNKRVLLLGDAHPSVIEDSLRSKGYSEDNPLKVDLVKLSHHGSKANTSNSLLEIIYCLKFVISTDGSRHNLPNKTTIARIHRHFPNAKIFFNYTSIMKKILKHELQHGFNAELLEEYIKL